MVRASKCVRLLIGLAILSSFIGCDQATKSIATSALKDSEVQSYLGDTVRLEYALNPGGFLSMGASFSPKTRFLIFVGFNVVVMCCVGVFLVTHWNARLAIFVSLSYMLAGGIGNLIDRIGNGGLVTDFLNLGIGPVRTGIFNVADVGVMFGAAVLVVSLFRESKLDEETDHELGASG